MTVRNEADSIQSVLDSLVEQTRTPEEILVVDGGSTDETRTIVRDFARRNPLIELLEAPDTTIAEGRNVGIAAAAGPIVALTDAGTRAEQTWLEHLVEPLDADPELAVVGGFFVAGGTTWFERVLSTIITPQLPEIDPETFLPSSRSVAFRKEWWERVGGYPEWLRHCEDLVFDMSLRRAGARFAFAPTAVVSWRARATLPLFARQYFDYARGDGHAGLWPMRHAARYSAYAAGVVFAALSRRHSSARAALLVGAGLHFSKFCRRLARRPPDTGLRLAAAFVALPFVVVTGDVAKMLGYALGLRERSAVRGEVEAGAGQVDR